MSENFRLMYNTIREDRGMEIFKDYDRITNHRFWWNFLGVFIEWIFILYTSHLGSVRPTTINIQLHLWLI